MVDGVNLGELTDEQLAELQQSVEEEQHRRYAIGAAAAQIVEVIRAYTTAGGDAQMLSEEIADALTSTDT